MSWIWSLLGMSESQPGNTSHWPKCFKHQAANWCIMLCIYIYISHGCIFSTVFYFPFIIANVQNNGVFDSFFRWSVYFLSFISQHKETQKSTCKPSIRDDTPFQTKKGVAPLREKTSPQHRIASEVHPVKAKAGANLRQQASLSRHWAGSAPDRLGKKPG